MIEDINAPNFFSWFIIPFFLALAIGYSIGIKYAIRDYRKGGYLVHDYNKTCANEVSFSCRHAPDYNRCFSREVSKCPYEERKTIRSAPIYVFIFIPIIIALIVASMVYKVVLFIRNPELAASVIIFNMFFNGRVRRHHTIRPRRHHRAVFWWN